jgi:hypothetical protein
MLLVAVLYFSFFSSFKRLPPVYDYRSQKLVSIEESLQPIESEIDELPYYIKIVKKHCQHIFIMQSLK